MITLFIIFFLKAFAVVMFGMNVAVVLTWVDRRQGSLIQDRIGPNRAALWAPAWAFQGAAAVGGLGLAAAMGGLLATSLGTPAPVLAGRALLVFQLGVLAAWVLGLIVVGRAHIAQYPKPIDFQVRQVGDPRNIFYGGLALHVAGFVAHASTGAGMVAWSRFALISGAVLFIGAALATAAYTVVSLAGEGLVPIRLAGLLHPAADGLKTLLKEDFVPPKADKLMHGIAPIISFFPSLVVLAVVPFADTLCFVPAKDGSLFLSGALPLPQLMDMVPRDGLCTTGAVNAMVVDLNVGILYFFAVSGTGIVGAALAGWASDNKFSLLGGLRAASQMVSYEVTLGLTLVGMLMLGATLRVDDLVRWQANNAWGVFVQPLGFVLFFAASVAEAKRIPFDLPEGESEIVAGYYTEYSGMKFAMFFFAEYVAVVSSSALMAALFLGGWHVPFLFRDGFHVQFGTAPELMTLQLNHGVVIALGALAFVLKTLALCFLSLTIRWTLPRFRYDQLMQLGWQKLLPASLLNLLLTGLFILLAQGAPAPVQQALVVAGQVTHAIVAVGTLALVVWFVLFLLEPVRRARFTGSSSAKFAEAAGGTPRFDMGA